MKKKAMFCIVVLFFCVLLTACACEHEWIVANCTVPKTCSKCGETDGESLGHVWVDATCLLPKSCSRCHKLEGSLADHKKGNWEITETDYIDAETISKQFCTVCHAELGSREGTLTRLHKDGVMLITPKDFIRRINNFCDQILPFNIYIQASHDDNVFIGEVYTDNSLSGLFGLYVGDEGITVSQLNDQCFDNIVFTSDDMDTFAGVFVSTVLACDPTLDPDKALDLCSKVADGSIITKNGITYHVYLGETSFLFVELEE